MAKHGKQKHHFEHHTKSFKILKIEQDTLLRQIKSLSESILSHNSKISRLMAKQSEDAQKLRAFAVQLDKVNQEIQSKIEELKNAAANADVTPELQEAIDGLATKVQALDDIVPDVETGGGGTGGTDTSGDTSLEG